MNIYLKIFSKLPSNVRRLPLCRWYIYRKNLRNLENVHALNYENTCPALQLILRLCLECRPGSVVGIATGYGLDGPRIDSRWGRDFSHLSSPALGPAQPPVHRVPGLSRG